MSLQDLGNVGELLGAVAVLISFIYLARQIRQNSRAARAATEQSISRAWTSALSVPAQSSENAVVFYRGLRSPEDLSEGELMHFSLMLQLLFNQYEQAYLSYLEGSFSQRRWDRIDRAIGLYTTRPGFEYWWQRVGHLLTAEFREYLQRRTADGSGRAAQQGLEWIGG